METQNSAIADDIGLNGAAFETGLSGLPLATYRAGESVLTTGSKTGRLLILKKGAVAIFKDSVEIGRVEEPGAVFGELSALLDRPHTADVRAVKDSQFHIADAALLGKDPKTALYVAKILAQRLVTSNKGLVELKKQLLAGQTPGAVRQMIDSIEEVLKVSSYTFEQWL